jgi:hypothetical protein
MKNTQPANRKKRVKEREEKRREEAEVKGKERTKADDENKGEGRRGVNSRGRTRMICRTRTNETAFSTPYKAKHKPLYTDENSFSFK